MAKPAVEPISVSVPTAAGMVGVSRSQMYVLVNNQAVRSTRIGGRRVVLVSSLRELVGEAA
jgi:predicted DNA-binding transcriptional regulator AlpA